MAVEWIGDTVNTPLKAKYDLAVSKINELENFLASKNIVIQYVNNLRSTLDTLTTNSLNMVSAAMGRILAIDSLFIPVDPSIKNDSLSAMKNAVNKVLDGEILIIFIDSMQNLINNLDNITDGASNDVVIAVNAAIDQVRENTDAVINAINNGIAAISELNKSINKFTQNMSKVAAIVNCFDDSMLNDSQLSNNIEKTSPTLKDVISTVREAKNIGKDKTTILKEANEKIASNLNLNDKFAGVKNKLSLIV